MRARELRPGLRVKLPPWATNTLGSHATVVATDRECVWVRAEGERYSTFRAEDVEALPTLCLDVEVTEEEAGVLIRRRSGGWRYSDQGAWATLLDRLGESAAKVVGR